MRKLPILLFFLLTIRYSPFAVAQEIPASHEQKLENQAGANPGETEDDNWLQDLEPFRKYPLNLNTALAEDLKLLRILTDLQIASFLMYRNLLGRLISLYELQAVPSWDLSTIKRLLPYVTVSKEESFTEQVGKRFRYGEHSLLFRLSQVLENSGGFDSSAAGRYLGSPLRMLVRYRYNFRNLLQFGLLGDKDAGEQFLKGAQGNGFDFYSFHFFVRKAGIIQSLALGDFTVNMGQGLIQWQGLAFKKSMDIMGIKRQSAVLRPYQSAGEFYFHRGAGVTVKTGKFESTVFVSLRKLSANVVTDTIRNAAYISSILHTGYHRTRSEVADRNSLSQLAFGASAVYRTNRWQAGTNAVFYHYSLPLKKREEPYNLYAISGRNWYNISMDYCYSYRNLHFFGEAATDKNLQFAFVNGLLLSVDPRVDISLLHRHISPAYQAVYGNAFTENPTPGNETGLYAGISIRPANGWKLDAYTDMFRFPWLKYLVDAPSQGSDLFAQLTCTPDRQTEIYTRYRSESKQANQPGNSSAANFLVFLPRRSWRTQISYQVSMPLTLRARTELLWYGNKGLEREQGFLLFTDFLYKPLLRPFSGVIRLLYFETGGYNSRIYAYENDLLYSYSIPALYGKGVRYYLGLDHDLSRKVSCWIRWGQTFYLVSSLSGPGPEEIRDARRSEIKAQLRWLF